MLAIEAALYHISQISDKFMCILTDSLAAIQNIIKYSPSSYAHRVIPIQKKLLDLNNSDREIIFQWIPSHCGVPGNERADSIAKFAINFQPKPLNFISMSSAKALIHTHIKNIWIKTWLSTSTGINLLHILKKPNDLKMYHNIPRKIQTFGSRARTGHIVTQSYLYRFHLADSPICLLCN